MIETIIYIYKLGLKLPLKIPEITHTIAEQSRVLGVIGSLVIFTFLVAILYSFIGQKRVLRRMKEIVSPFKEKIPEAFYPYFISILKVVIAAFIKNPSFDNDVLVWTSDIFLKYSLKYSIPATSLQKTASSL